MKPLVFFGTPEFAVPSLDALVAAGEAPALVVSQPDRPAGRGHRDQPPPVARRARELGLPLVQVERVRDAGFLSRIEEMAPQIAVVVAFGQIFPQRLLDLPARGCVNLHASLLPRWRGAAPIAAAIAAGDAETGVCTMKMEAGLDTGPVYLCRRLAIGERETAGELGERLAGLGATLLVETLRALARGELAARPQPEAGATYAPRLKKEDGRLDWRRPAVELERQVRASTPAPGATAELRGAPVRLLAVEVAGAGSGPPGEILGVDGDRLRVACGEGALAIARLQRAGGRPVSGREFAAGARFAPGERFA
jgi:methionyl-tRNA formyltransferase